MIAEDDNAPAAETRRLITISVPVLNEADNIDRLIDRLSRLAASETGYDFEFLFTDNASTDATFEKLAAHAQKDQRIRVLRFSRNFGFQISILMNYLNARGHAAVQIDADLQDPPELISEFLREWENGYKVVYGVRKARQEPIMIKTTRKAYYRLVSWLSESDLPVDAGDFRLIDRTIIEELREIKEQTPYLRGVIANMGYAQLGIPYDRTARQAGYSKFKLSGLVSLGLDGITSQSVRPLRLLTLAGLGIFAASMVLIAFYFLIFFFSRENVPSGFTTLTLIALISLGVNTFAIGLVGEYVGRIFNNTRGLPLALIERRIEPPTDRDAARGGEVAGSTGATGANEVTEAAGATGVPARTFPDTGPSEPSLEKSG